MPRFNFPPWLAGSEEQRKAEEERQSTLRASFSHARQNDAERMVGRGALLEQTARINLRASWGRNKEARIFAQNQLADALALQGRFAEAAVIHTEKHRRKYFRTVAKALRLNDSSKCKCKDTKIKRDGREEHVSPRFVKAEVYSAEHKAIVSFVGCAKCSHLNARPLTGRLQQQQAELKRNELTQRR
jgi:hypothetical protein